MTLYYVTKFLTYTVWTSAICRWRWRAVVIVLAFIIKSVYYRSLITLWNSTLFYLNLWGDYSSCFSGFPCRIVFHASFYDIIDILLTSCCWHCFVFVFFNSLAFPADKISKSNTGGGSFCWIGIQYAMPYS